MSPAVRHAAPLLLLALAACGERREVAVTPWFRVEQRREATGVPRALSVGETSETAFMQLNGRWQQVAKAQPRLAVYPLDDALLVLARNGASLYWRGARPLLLDDGTCTDVAVRADAPRFVCAGCGASAPLWGLAELEARGVACPWVTASERDARGRVLWTRTARFPALPAGCRPGRTLAGAFSPEGAPLFRVVCPKDSGTRFFALTEGGFEELAPGTRRVEGRAALAPEERG